MALSVCILNGSGYDIVQHGARLSEALSSLFGGGACAADLRGRGDPNQLLPAETAALGRAVASRVQEFAAGRSCARLALAQFGILDVAIERAQDRRPLWPATVVGSITHSGEYCAAVVASRATTAAIGLDSEGVANLTPGLWPSICSPMEMRWLATLPEHERIAAASLIFSAKEAFYKCQYPLTGERLGFHDARIELREWDTTHGDFTVEPARPIAFAAHVPLPLTGRFLFHDSWVTAAVRVAA